MYKSIKDLAKDVTTKEGGKVQVNITQVGEILKVLNELVPNFYDFVKGKVPTEVIEKEVIIEKNVGIDKQAILDVITDCWTLSRQNRDDGDRMVEQILKLI